MCFHKSLFGSRFSLDDLYSFIIFFVAAGISAGGGVGGGGILSGDERRGNNERTAKESEREARGESEIKAQI